MRYRLLQARLPSDRVRYEEHAAFVQRLGVRADEVEPWDLLSQPLDHGTALGDADAVLVGGSGAFSVYDDAPWLPGFIDLMGALADQGTPTFASCFGFQALVVALGGEVRKDEAAAEVGSFEISLTPEAAVDPLFGLLPERFIAQQGHKDRAVRWPGGLVHLARSERCPYQALRVADKPVYATQFHPELTWEENRTRFSRYFDMYKGAFGESQAQRMLDSFVPSPQANGLLGRFHRLLASGEL